MRLRRKFVLPLCALAAGLALSGCSVQLGSDTESLLRAPQLSGETSAVQKALNSYLGSVATLRYPVGGDFLSPFLFGDWDGDGEQEAAVLYTVEASGANVCLAVLEPAADGWRVAQTVEGLSSEVESVSYANLWDANSQQLLVGYGSAQGDRYLVVYHYHDGGLRVVISQSYTDMIVANITGAADTQDLVLALPTEVENGGVTLQLLTVVDGEFRSAQTLAVGAGSYNGCAGLHAGVNRDGAPYLVVDGWGATASSLASAIISYDNQTGFLTTFNPTGISDVYRATLRYDTALVSTDIDGNGTIDIPTEIGDGGELVSPMDKRLRFILWKDFSTASGGTTHFGIYDSEYRFFLPLPESMHGTVRIRQNAADTGWLICNAEGTVIYCELRVVDPAKVEPDEDYHRVANIGGRQLQVRVVTSYYGLGLDSILNHTILLQ